MAKSIDAVIDQIGRDALHVAYGYLVADPVQLPQRLAQVRTAADRETAAGGMSFEDHGALNGRSVIDLVFDGFDAAGVDLTPPVVEVACRRVAEAMASATYYAEKGQHPPRSPIDDQNAATPFSSGRPSPASGRVLLTIGDVAEHLGVSRRTVGRAVKNGEIPAFRVGKLYRIPARQFDAWLTRKRLKPWRPSISAVTFGGPSSRSRVRSSESRAIQLLNRKPSAGCSASWRKSAA